MFSCMPFSRQVDYVDKRQCNLNQIPEEIQRYTRSLEELLLDSNHIRELSKPLFRLHKLRRLALSDNEISKLPPDISQLANLIELDLSKNDIADIPENIKNCKHLQYLDVSNNPLISFPLCIIQLNALTHLGLNDISLAEVSLDIGQLINLRILELRDNVISYLPPSFASLTKLKVLDLGTNEFEKFPQEICKLLGLEELYVDGNSLEYLPKDIANLQQLVSFDAAENKLLALPEELGDLKNLSDLTLSQNCLEALPNSIGKLKKLSILKLDKNRLINLTPAIGHCVSLTELILTENLLTEIPSSIGNMKELVILNIDKNRLKELPYTVGCCTNLGVLSLRDNVLGALIDEIGKLEKLYVLDVSGNRLQYLPYTLNALQHLNALWLCDNQSQPMLRLQTDYDQRTGVKVLTCYLLPQQDYRPESGRLQPLTNGVTALNSTAFAGGPKVHFPDVDQDSGDEPEESSTGKFERHDTPHPKHGPKPKGRRIDGHVIPHENAQVVSRQESFRPGAKPSDSLTDTDSSKRDDGYQSAGFNASNPEITVQTERLEHPLPSPASKSVNFTSDTGPNRPTSAYQENDEEEHESNRLTRKNTPHPLKTSSISPDAVAMQEKVAEILARQQKLSQKAAKVDDSFSAKPDKTMQKLNIVVQRDEKGLGLSIAGGLGSSPYIDDDSSIFISRVVDQGAAFRAGLRVGDKLAAVDGVDVLHASHNECVELMKTAASSERRVLALVVLRRLATSSNAPSLPPTQGGDDSVGRRTSCCAVTSSLNDFPSSNDGAAVAEYETIATTVRRDPPVGGGFGFRIAGGKGSSLGDFVHISKISADGSAERDAILKAGDRVVSINGVNVRDSRHDQAVALLTGAGPEVHLVVQREKPLPQPRASLTKVTLTQGDVPPLAQSSPVVSDAAFFRGPIECVTVNKRGGPLGLSIVGGSDHTSHPFGVTEPGVFVSKVVPDGAAAKTGQLWIGDRILSVNGQDLSQATHQEAVAALISKTSEITLVVRHDPQPAGLKELTINRIADEPLGIHLCGGVSSGSNPADSSDEGVFISEILTGSAACRDGRLKAGDRLLEVNNRSILGATRAQAQEWLEATGSHLQVLICDGLNPENFSLKDSSMQDDSVSPSKNTKPSINSAAAYNESRNNISRRNNPPDSRSSSVDESPQKKYIGIPVPKPYASKMPTAHSVMMTGSRSTDFIHNVGATVVNANRSTSDVHSFSETLEHASVSSVAVNPRLPAVPPKPALPLDLRYVAFPSGSDSKKNDAASQLLAQSKISPAKRESCIPHLSQNAAPSTPTSGDSNPERLPFTRKLEKFEHQIEQRTVDGEKSKLIPPKKISQLPVVSCSQSPTFAAADDPKKVAVVGGFQRCQSSKPIENGTSTNIGAMPASTSASSIPAVVRTKKAENRLKATQSSEKHSEQSSELSSSQLSPAEARALEAAKRAEWRKARLKSLERDALKAEKVMSRVQDITDAATDDVDDQVTNSCGPTNSLTNSLVTNLKQDWPEMRLIDHDEPVSDQGSIDWEASGQPAAFDNDENDRVEHGGHS